MIKIAIFNQKGGVGKTTTAISLAYALKMQNKKVLLLDLDPQANATTGLGVSESRDKTVYSMLLENLDPKEIALSVEGIDLLPSSLTLADAELELASTLSRELVLSRLLKKTKSDYDMCLIDCPPNLGLLSINALSAADYVLIPIYPSYFSIQGLASFTKYFQSIKNTINPEIEILGYLITKYDERKNLHKNLVRDLEEAMGDKVLKPYIRTNSKIEESQEMQISIFKLDKNNKGSLDYMDLSNEILRRIK